MFHSSSRTADKFAEEFDRHGDSYTEFATAESLRKAFDNVQSKVRRDFLAILVQNKAKYSIMLARRALSKMKKYDCTDGKQKIVKSLLKPLEKTVQSEKSTSVHGFRTSRIMLLRHVKEEQHSLPGSLFPFSR